MLSYKDIPRFTRDANYRINVGWDYLEEWLSKERSECNIDIDPDFQRGHVWSEKQQERFVEFMLKGGKGCNEIRFNCVGWMNTFEGPFVLVDGKQRLEAVRKFLRDELKVFGQYCSDFGRLRLTDCDMIIMVNELKTRKEVLQWYLDINTGGVVHTEKEIDKVRELLKKEV
jgi:hypothetical protein